MKQYKVGIYCRLSVDDASNSAKKNYIPADESVSIENQYEMLSKFCMMNGWAEVKSYRDDGYSGGSFNRPAFLEMIEDARHGLINLILVKDLSRLGRDFVEVGRYTDVIFPSLGCRFVSVLDCLDSEGDTDMLHFRSLMNDYHLKDLSEKIKSVLQAKRKSGQYLTPYAPFGYRKDENNKNHLVIEPETAEIVRRIFDLRYSGMAYGKITALLNQEGIPTPRRSWYGQRGNHDVGGHWKNETVKMILHNEIYLGNLVINRTGHRSYKDKSCIEKPESEWIRHEGTHEAIVNREIWDEVQRINMEAKRYAQTSPYHAEAIFRGKLFCADCGSKMLYNRSIKHYKSGVHVYMIYSCSQHQHSGKSICSRHGIAEMSLGKIVLQEIREQASAIQMDEAAVVERLRAQLLGEQTARLEETRQEIKRLRKRVDELERMTVTLYEDKVCSNISEETFLTLIQKNEQERQSKMENLDALTSVVDAEEQKCEDIQKWVAVMRKYLAVEAIDRDLLDELVERIEVGEKMQTEDGKRQDVTVVYRFVGVVR